MRKVLTILTTAALWCSLVSLGMAEDQNASRPPDTRKLEAKTDVSAGADLRIEIHRTMAELIAAQSAEQPDQTKIDKLTRKLQELRAKSRSQALSAAGNQPLGWACPWGGPGRGYGRGAAWNGCGRGLGAGRGPGGGAGRGFGPGGGLGLGPGGGAFVDEDKDGICDRYELRHGMHQ